MEAVAKKSLLGCMVKTPGASLVKTRLAASVGNAQATAIYLACVAQMRTLMHSLDPTQWQCSWAVAESKAQIKDHAIDNAIWSDLPQIFQGKGGLGARMASVIHQSGVEYWSSFLIGADCPQITVQDLEAGRALLEGNDPCDVVFGPAHDGGFWLVGLRLQIPIAIWDSVEYSTHSALSDLCKALQEWKPDIKISTQDLPLLTDIDLFSDVAQAESQMNAHTLKLWNQKLQTQQMNKQ